MSGPDSDNKPKRTGRVRHEPGGRAIWEWAIDSGRHAIDSTSRLLQKLDLSSLTLLDDDEKPWQDEKPRAGTHDPGRRQQDPDAIPTFGGAREQDPRSGERGGFNPYDSRTPGGRGVASTAKPAAPPRPRITQPVRPAKKGLLARLFERK